MTEASPTSAKVQKRAFVKLDRYGHFDIAREYNLTPDAHKALVFLVSELDFRDGTTELTTLGVLAKRMDLTRRKMTAVVDELQMHCLIDTPMPFKRNAHGCIRVLVLDQLITDAKPELVEKLRICAEYARNTRSIRADLHISNPSSSVVSRGGGSEAERVRGAVSFEVQEQENPDRPQNAESERNPNGIQMSDDPSYFCHDCDRVVDDRHSFAHNVELSRAS